MFRYAKSTIIHYAIVNVSKSAHSLFVPEHLET
jgi:hypothetical protein